MQTFEPSIVDAVIRHMNENHPEDSLIIVRAFAEHGATSAEMTSVDATGGDWMVDTPTGQRQVRLGWTNPASERGDLRREIVVLYERACLELGIAARPH